MYKNPDPLDLANRLFPQAGVPFNAPFPTPAAPFNLAPFAPFQPFHGQGLPLQPTKHKYRPTSAPLPACVLAVLARPVSYYTEKAAVRQVSTRAPLTHVAFALDCSSSMMTGKSATIEGFNRQVSVVEENAPQAGETRFTEVLFGDSAKVRQVAARLSAMVRLNNENYVPGGCTALYDGTGSAIAALLQTEGAEDPNTAFLVTVFTDGGENNSRQFDAGSLRELILRLEATGRWTFALVGPQGSVHTLAELLAVREGNVAAYHPESVASREQAFHSVVGASATYMSARAAGATSVMNLYGGEN
jgi:hypothetical protein